jgi:protease-4
LSILNNYLYYLYIYPPENGNSKKTLFACPQNEIWGVYMKTRSVLLGITIVGVLIVLFVSSVFIARLIQGGKGGFMAGKEIGVVEVKGLILDSKETIKQLHDFKNNQNVKAVVLRIDSPGGVVGPSQEIYEEVKKLTEKKKVVVSMGSVAASGGYYIAAPANRIFANPGTVTGSIGVLMKLSNIEGLLGKIGLKSYVLKSGKYKDAGSPFRPMTREEKAIMQSVIDSMHSQFIKAVADGRKLPRETVTRIADGRIFSGEQALNLKLVDKLGDLQDAVAEAAKMAGIRGEPQVIYPPEKKSLLRDLLIEEVVGRIAGLAGLASGGNARYEIEGVNVLQ